LLVKKGIKIVQKPKDHYLKPAVCGYRDIILNVEFPNGHIGEIQLNCNKMMLAKLQGHAYYEKMRVIDGKAKLEGRKKLTDEEVDIMADANRKMKALYEKAYKETLA